MSDEQKPKGKPIGYVTQDVRRRRTRPVHADRKAILAAAAEAVFAKAKAKEPKQNVTPSEGK